MPVPSHVSVYIGASVALLMSVHTIAVASVCVSKIAPIAANINARCCELPSPQKCPTKHHPLKNNARSITFRRRQLYNTK